MLITNKPHPGCIYITQGGIGWLASLRCITSQVHVCLGLITQGDFVHPFLTQYRNAYQVPVADVVKENELTWDESQLRQNKSW